MAGGGTLKDSVLVSSSPVTVTGSFNFDNVTIASGTEVINQAGGSSLVVRNGLVIDGRLSVGTAASSTTVAFASTQTIGGTGDIVFSSAASNLMTVNTSGLTVTFGTALKLRGKNVSFSGAASAGNTTNYVFQGLIQPDVAAGVFSFDARITATQLTGRIEPINGSTVNYFASTLPTTDRSSVALPTRSSSIHATPFPNTSSITTTGGSLTLSNLSNTGTISVTNTAVTLSGALTQAAIGSATPGPGQGTFLRSGGSVTLAGTLTGNLTLDAVTGAWLMAGGGTLKDSVLVSSSPVTVTGSFNFDNVTIASGTEVINQSGGSSLVVRNGLVIDGRLSVGTAASSTTVAFASTQTIEEQATSSSVVPQT